MRILHTADWHIGKNYNNTNFLPDFDFFAQQLIQIIEENKVQILLVSGDVFDVYSPSSLAQKAYYGLLSQLVHIPTLENIIITAGNHDSTAFIEAPSGFMRKQNILIFGQATSPQDCWQSITIGNETVNIACVPFLRNNDFPALENDASFDDFRERNAQGLINYYKLAQEHQPKKGAHIALGHFTCVQDYTIDSERDITIGNIDGTSKSALPLFDYFALGHIHKPMTVSASRNIYYSGSPYPMSFSEKNDEKQVNIITITDGAVQLEVKKLNHYRSFESIKGNSIQDIENTLKNYNSSTSATQLELVLNNTESSVLNHKKLTELQIQYNELWLDKSITIEKVRLERHQDVKSVLDKPEFNREFKSPNELLNNILEHHSEKYGGHENDMRNAFLEIIESTQK